MARPPVIVFNSNQLDEFNCQATVTLEKVKDGIRSLTPSERIELYRWLDYNVAVESVANEFCSRIGADRSLEIRQAIKRILALEKR
ncbi:MAG: hypothetical protein JOZ60_06255 [Verrucomicrobia bacterium]|nr:hypothetical protein [Verrucomicrobiota bacterium]